MKSKNKKEHKHIWMYFGNRRICEGPFPTIEGCGKEEIINPKNKKEIIRKAVKRGVKEYAETFRLLAEDNHKPDKEKYGIYEWDCSRCPTKITFGRHITEKQKEIIIKEHREKHNPKPDTRQWEKEAVGKNVHSVYVLCNECHTWGVNMPLERTCGNCNSKDTMTFYDRETIANLLLDQQRAFEEMLVDKDMTIPVIPQEFKAKEVRNQLRKELREKLKKLK